MPNRNFDLFSNPLLLAGVCLAHVILTLIMHRVGWLVPIHVLLIVGWGVWAAITKRDAAFMSALAYIAGAEVAWRILDPYHRLPYELGKYAVIVLCGLWMIRRRARPAVLPILYFVLLLPSIWLTFQQYPALEDARQQIVFNLAGPCALACAVIVCAHIRLTRDDLWSVFLSLLVALMCIATLLLRERIASDVPIWDLFPARQLSTARSFASNQVSTILSLGLLIMWLMVVLEKPKLKQIVLFCVIGLVFILTILMSFTRGGIVIAAISMVGAAVPLMLRGDQGKRISMLLGAIFGVMAILFVVVSIITKGSLWVRYTNYGLSNRDEWAVDDLEMFAQHPLMGVGPGVGKEYRTMRNQQHWPAHTEFTRMLGEHGLFGFLSLGLLILMAWRLYRAAGDVAWRSIMVGLLIWVALYMAHSATRIVAPSVMFGRAGIRLLSGEGVATLRPYDTT